MLTPARFMGLALVAWALCFAVLARSGTWLPFALVGAALTVLAFTYRVLPWALLRPSFGCVGAGVLGGGVMVLLTHLAYGASALVVPGVRPATGALFGLLNVAGFSAPARATLIVLIASCEEVLFRGPLLELAARRERLPTLPLLRRESARVLMFAAVYALATLPLGSPLLIVCAFACGSIWGWMGLAARSLTVPILAHVIWDLGVLLVWPLSTRF